MKIGGRRESLDAVARATSGAFAGLAKEPIILDD